MTERRLKLVKTEKIRVKQMRRTGRKQYHSPRIEQIQNPSLPILTPEEAAEARRFKAMAAAKAAQQAMIYRIMAELEELDQTSPAA